MSLKTIAVVGGTARRPRAHHGEPVPESMTSVPSKAHQATVRSTPRGAWGVSPLLKGLVALLGMQGLARGAAAAQLQQPLGPRPDGLAARPQWHPVPVSNDVSAAHLCWDRIWLDESQFEIGLAGRDWMEDYVIWCGTKCGDVKVLHPATESNPLFWNGLAKTFIGRLAASLASSCGMTVVSSLEIGRAGGAGLAPGGASSQDYWLIDAGREFHCTVFYGGQGSLENYQCVEDFMIRKEPLAPAPVPSASRFAGLTYASWRQVAGAGVIGTLLASIGYICGRPPADTGKESDPERGDGVALLAAIPEACAAKHICPTIHEEEVLDVGI